MRGKLIGMCLLGIINSVGFGPAIAQTSETPQPNDIDTLLFLRPETTCPQEIETLTSGLLRDLPSYANRVAYRSLGISEDATGFGTLLLAGQAEFEPLDVSTLTFTDASELTPERFQQIFFTTLEWQYTTTDSIPLEQYHWLFLTEAEDGWRLALMFSRIANDESASRPPTPPQESSEGIVGQAVRLWLRDCRAGDVYPIESDVYPIESEAVMESETVTDP